ncbi:MAG: prefoldin subunit alpha [Promethearchaeota archaeon]
MESNENIEQQLYQFRYLKEQRDMFLGQLELVNASLGNLLNTKTTIDNLKDIKEGQEILLPIGGLINIKANIKDPEKILLYVSQDIVVEKNIEGTKEFLERLIEQHNTQIKYIQNQIRTLDANLQGMSQNIQRSYQLK